MEQELIIFYITIGNFIFSQLARTSYVDRNIASLRRNLESQINDLERKLGLTSSEIESNASHISKIYPNGIPREVYLYKRGNLEKDKPYKITTKIQYTNDGSIKIINRFHDNGEIMLTGGFIAEQPNGKWIEWYESGQKKKEGTYKDGIKDGKWIHSTDIGNGKYEVKYTKGNIDLATFTDNLGQTYSGIPVNEELKADGQYLYQEHEYNFSKYPEAFATIKNGELDGLLTRWHENGQKKWEATLKDGKPDGLLTRWYENGQKEFEETYKDGAIISSKCWDWDGNEMKCN